MGKIAIAALAGLLSAAPALAERVVVPVGQQAALKEPVTTPRRGLNKDKVRERFGEPANVKPPVGEPPISAWEYPEYIVYFEHDLVLHAVVKPNGLETPETP